MSPGLRGEVAMITYGAMIQSVPYLANVGQSFVTQIALKLEPMVLSPGELIVPAGARTAHLYFVADGVVSTKGKLQTSGFYFGEEVIMESGRHAHPVRSVSYCNLYTVSAEDMNQILDDFPRVKKLIRRAVMQMSFKRDIRRVLKELMNPTPAVDSNKQETALSKIEALERQLLKKDEQLQSLLAESTALQMQISEQLPKCQVFSSMLVNKPEERRMLKEIEAMQEQLATSSQDTVRQAQHKFWKTRRVLGHNSLLISDKSTLGSSLFAPSESERVTKSDEPAERNGSSCTPVVPLEAAEGVGVPSGVPARDEMAVENNPLSDPPTNTIRDTNKYM